MLSIVFTVMEAVMASKLIKRGASKWVAAIPVAAFLLVEVGLSAVVLGAGLPLVMMFVGLLAVHGAAAAGLAIMLKKIPEIEEAPA